MVDIRVNEGSPEKRKVIGYGVNEVITLETGKEPIIIKRRVDPGSPMTEMDAVSYKMGHEWQMKRTNRDAGRTAETFPIYEESNK